MSIDTLRNIWSAHIMLQRRIVLLDLFISFSIIPISTTLLFLFI